MKISFINWSQVFCILIAGFVVWWIYQYPYDRLFIPTHYGDSVIGPYTHTARAIAITYVVCLGAAFTLCLYRRDNCLEEPPLAPSDTLEATGSWPPTLATPRQDQERQRMKLRAAALEKRRTLANVLFFLLILPFLLPAIIGPFLQQYFYQQQVLFLDVCTHYHIDSFAYLTSPPILALLLVCTVPVLAYYGIFARGIDLVRRRFRRSS